MLVDPGTLIAALRMPAETQVDFEPLGEAAAVPERVALGTPGGPERVVLLRRALDPEASANHLAVMEALTNRSFPHAPRLLAIVGDVGVEEWIEGVTALALVPPTGAAEAAITALAALHGLPVREGLNWGMQPADLLASDELPLHRLGFAYEERDAARGPLEAAREALLHTPFGFTHGDPSAAHVLLAKDVATLVNFEQAGYASQFMDIAAFLLTSGLDAPARRALAAQYARLRNLDLFATIDGIDVAGVLWGIAQQLTLPRRLIEALGDDPASEAIHTAGARIDRGIRSPSGDHPSAAAIRAALWPE
ncbi:MAG: hypothetical protein ABI305_07415 [Tepidiformaceae bacterium]